METFEKYSVKKIETDDLEFLTNISKSKQSNVLYLESNSDYYFQNAKYLEAYIPDEIVSLVKAQQIMKFEVSKCAVIAIRIRIENFDIFNTETKSEFSNLLKKGQKILEYILKFSLANNLSFVQSQLDVNGSIVFILMANNDSNNNQVILFKYSLYKI